MLSEKRNNLIGQITPLPNTVPIHVLFVVVVPLIDINSANSKEPHEHVETIGALRALGHRKLVRHLETSSVTASVLPIGLPDEVD